MSTPQPAIEIAVPVLPVQETTAVIALDDATLIGTWQGSYGTNTPDGTISLVVSFLPGNTGMAVLPTHPSINASFVWERSGPTIRGQMHRVDRIVGA